MHISTMTFYKYNRYNKVFYINKILEYSYQLTRGGTFLRPSFLGGAMGKEKVLKTMEPKLLENLLFHR